jgi:hypothetical protein
MNQAQLERYMRSEGYSFEEIEEATDRLAEEQMLCQRDSESQEAETAAYLREQQPLLRLDNRRGSSWPGEPGLPRASSGCVGGHDQG